jgi:prolyl 4-hydroxylase
MNGTLMTDEWANWIKINLERKCDKNEMFKILLQNGFDHATISENLKMKSCCNDETETNDTNEYSNVDIQEYRIKNKNLEIYKMEHFLSDEECDSLLEEINKETFSNSTITNVNESDKNYRTSSTCYLDSKSKGMYQKLDKKICNILNISKYRSEPMQAQKYSVGQEFKQHTDYFCNTDYNKDHLKNGGQRTWTFMIYLNNVDEGGETRFNLVDLDFAPVKGCAIFWNNLNKNANENVFSTHGGLPILKGEKYIITKWFRQNETSYY